MKYRIINPGCGQNTIQGAINIDSSPSVWLAYHPFICNILKRFRILKNSDQIKFIDSVREKNIKYGNVFRMPCRDESVDVVYICRMIEYLYPDDFDALFRECNRVLKTGGAVRIVLTDLRKRVEKYQKTGDGDAFLESLYMVPGGRPCLKKRIHAFLFGDRDRVAKWMWDTESFKKRVKKYSAFDVYVLEAGETKKDGLGKQINLEDYKDSEVAYIEMIKR